MGNDTLFQLYWYLEHKAMAEDGAKRDGVSVAEWIRRAIVEKGKRDRISDRPGEDA